MQSVACQNGKKGRDPRKMNFQSLIWQEPWLTPVILNVQHIVETEAIPTAAVTPNGKTLYYNPHFWKGLSKKEKIGVQLHELLHIVNLHIKRREYRDFEKWNIACDMAINYQITSSGYMLPKNALDGENDTAEHIYGKLHHIRVEIDGENKRKSLYTSNRSQTQGNSKTESEGISESRVILADDLLKKNEDGSEQFADPETLEAVETSVQLAGIGSTPLARHFTPLPSKADWRIVLQSLIKSVLGEEFDYLSYEFDEFGICEDILSAKPRPKLCVLIDESSSIEDALYQQFLGEIGKMMRFADVYASGFAWDTELQAVPLKEYRRTMTGGTNLLRAYGQACKLTFDGILVLTDGYLDFPANEPKPTIWVMPKTFGRNKEVIL